MSYMFGVCSSLLQPNPCLPVSDVRMIHWFVSLCLQGAAVFNQPLSFNTSSVIYMVGMFGVRPLSRDSPAHALTSLARPTCVRLFLIICLLGRTHWFSISHCVLRRPASETWAGCSGCALRAQLLLDCSCLALSPLRLAGRISVQPAAEF